MIFYLFKFQKLKKSKVVRFSVFKELKIFNKNQSNFQQEMRIEKVHRFFGNDFPDYSLLFLVTKIRVLPFPPLEGMGWRVVHLVSSESAILNWGEPLDLVSFA